MFTTGQLIFAIIFLLSFVLLMIWSYRKDLKSNKYYYKNVWVIGLAVLVVIALFTIITFAVHK